MLLDYEGGRKLELEAIYGNPLKVAEMRGAELPRMRMLYEALQQFLECN